MTVGFYYLAVLLAFCVTLPFAVNAGAHVTLADVVAFPTSACLVIEVLRSVRARARIREVYRANRFVFGYVGWAAIAGVIGLTRSPEALKAFKDLVPPFVLYVLVSVHVDRPRRLRTIAMAVLAGLGVHVALGFVQSIFGAPYLLSTSPGLEAKLDISGEVLRNTPVGLFSHPNALAVYLLPGLVFAAVAVHRSRNRWWAALALVPILYVFERTQAKGAFVFFALGLAMLVVPRRLERWRFAIGIALPALAVTAVVWYALDRFLSGAEGYATVLSRIELWNRAADVIGSDRFTQVAGSGYATFAAADIVSFEYPSAHNGWLNQILSFGIPGFLLYVGCFANALRTAARKLAVATAGSRAILLGTFASLSALAGEYFFEPLDRGNAFPGQLFLLLALVTVVPVTTSALDREIR